MHWPNQRPVEAYSSNHWLLMNCAHSPLSLEWHTQQLGKLGISFSLGVSIFTRQNAQTHSPGLSLHCKDSEFHPSFDAFPMTLQHDCPPAIAHIDPPMSTATSFSKNYSIYVLCPGQESKQGHRIQRRESYHQTKSTDWRSWGGFSLSRLHYFHSSVASSQIPR